MKSESIKELSAALAKAQLNMGKAHKSQTNPFFKTKYADLASCWDACREPLSKNGLSVAQFTVVHQGTLTTTKETTDKNGNVYVTRESFENPMALKTILMHESGEWIEGYYPIKATKEDPQGLGSALTYARRYALSALVGICQEDDDGNAASRPSQQKIQPKQQAKQAPKAQPKQETKRQATPIERCKNGLQMLNVNKEDQEIILKGFNGKLDELTENLKTVYNEKDDALKPELIATIKKKAQEALNV